MKRKDSARSKISPTDQQVADELRDLLKRVHVLARVLVDNSQATAAREYLREPEPQLVFHVSTLLNRLCGESAYSLLSPDGAERERVRRRLTRIGTQSLPSVATAIAARDADGRNS